MALATLLHGADIYTAKLSGRATREAMAADGAGREVFMRIRSQPTHAIVGVITA